MVHWRSMVLLLLYILLCGLLVTNASLDQFSDAASEERSINFTFTQPLYNVSVYQNAMPRTRLISSTPHMGVTLVGGKFPPEKTGGPPWVEFRMVKETKEFVVAANRVGDFYFLDIRTSDHVQYSNLNREKQATHVFAVTATYRAGSATMACRTTVFVEVLDYNDNCPIFRDEKYNFTVADDMPVGTILGRVEATDADVGINARLYYVMFDRTQHFRLDPYSGILYLARPINARTFPRQHRINVQAAERVSREETRELCKSVSKIDVIITIKVTNRYPPTATVQTLSAIHTPGRRGTVYAVIKVNDEDIGQGGKIDRIEIVNDTAIGDFAIRRISDKQFSLVLRRDITQMHLKRVEDVYLRVWDAGKPPRSTLIPQKVTFVNNDQYQLSLPKRISLEVSENALVNTTIYCLNATTAVKLYNARIVYSYIPTVAEPYFFVNPSGAVIVKRPLDAETLPRKFQLGVEASDSNNYFGEMVQTTTLTITLINANDNPPVVRNDGEEVTIPETAPTGSFVLKINAYDPDRATVQGGLPLTYKLINEEALPFGLDPRDPSRIIVKSQLDSERMPERFKLSVRVSDRGQPIPRRTDAKFDVLLQPSNDNPPVFKCLRCTVYLGNRATDVGTFDAIDLDDPNQIVNYEFVKHHSCFTIARSTGHVGIACPLSKLPTTTQLQLQADDGQLKSNILEVTVIYKHKSNSSSSSNCVSSGIEDTRNSQYRMRIEYASKLDRAEKEEKREMGPAREENRYSPEFPANMKKVIHVYEDKAVGSILMQITAEDKDDGQFSYAGRVVYAIADGNSNDTFQLTTHEEQTATLSLLRPLDRELLSKYNLLLRVCDLGSPRRCATRRLRVVVNDVNDCAPVFSRNRLRRIYIPENTAVGTKLIKFNATDCDKGRFGRVRFRLKSHRRTFNITKRGQLALKSKLDRESQSRFVLMIRAFNAKHSKSTSIQFEVMVTDINDNRPKFVPPTYHLTLMEDLPSGAYITTLHAVDPDEGFYGLIRYRLIGKDASCFTCDAISGVVRLECSLDYKRHYQLIAVASDQGTPPLQTQTELSIKVRAVQVNLRPPVFPANELHFEATVQENSPQDTFVTRLSATDPEETRVTYQIIGGSGMGRFRIDDQGTIRTNEVLDFETMSSYWLLVQARDSGVVPLTAFSEIYIRVGNVNDNAPMPSKPEYSATVAENSPSGVELVRVQAYDMDGSNEGVKTRLEYVITKGDPGLFFNMDRYTGRLTTKQRIDRDTHREFALEVTIYDRGTPPLNTTVNVYIQVEDENDNDPWFLVRELTLLTFPVNMTAKNSSRKPLAIGRVVASDRDALNNGTVTYSLDNFKEKFRIDPETGHIYSRVNLKPKETFNLMIRATDGGKPPLHSRAKVIVNVIPIPTAKPTIAGEKEQLKLNDIEDYFASESHVPGTALGYVSAKDGDELSRPLVFYIKEKRVPIFLEPMPFTPGDTHHTTVVRVAQMLDYEEQKRYNLTLCVTNGLKTICHQLIVHVTDINEWRPVFDRSIETAQISETLPVGSTVLELSARDRDPGRRGLHYRIEYVEQQETRKLFRLDQFSGVLTVASPLDHERMTSHTMLVNVYDTGIGHVFHASSLVKLTVTDSNEAAPQFLVSPDILPLKAVVRDNSLLGSRIIQVSAFDPDRGERSAKLHYEITDGGLVSAWFPVPHGNWDRLFRIGETGYILVNDSLLDYSSKSYKLEVTATDNGKPRKSNSTHVIIEVKSVIEEERPKFLKKSVGKTLLENVPVGTIVTVMSCKSVGPVFYRIIKGNKLDLFSIADTTGLVVTKAPIDREKHGDYFSLTIEVTSADAVDGPFDTATLAISIQDVNDNRPTVEDTNLSGWISEAAGAGAVVHSDNGKGPLVIRSHDPDFGLNGKLHFEIRSVIAKSYFMVDEDTYVLRRGKKKALDREHQSSFLLTILVSDRGRPLRLSADQLVVVRIRIIDINDNPPRFPVATPNHLIIKLPAFAGKLLLKTGVEDPDTVSQGQVEVRIRSGNEKNYFRVNSTNGDLYLTTDSLPAAHTFHLMFEATDGLFTARHNISLETRSGRKNSSPNFKFNKKRYSAVVVENSTAVRDLLVVGINGSRRFDVYMFDILNPSRYFTMSRTTGVLRTSGVPVDREVDGPVLKLLVKATDKYRRQAFAWIHVSVEDVNDCQPIFVDQPFNAVVLNTARKGTYITKVQAIDRDAGDNGRLTYSLTGMEPTMFLASSYFDLKMDSGKLYLSQQLPSAVTNKKFTLHIKVHDNGRPYPLDAAAVINLQIVTKNTPVFEKSSYETSIYENAPPNEAVMTLNATSPRGATLIYSIMSGNAGEKFSLDFSTAYNQPGPCVLKTADYLDYEKRKQYKLRIRVTEKSAGLYSQVIATIKVKDVNDVRPVFKDKEAIAYISEKTRIGSLVLTVVASDEDTGAGGKTSYSFEEVEPGRRDSESFSINDKGQVKVTKPLDYEIWPIHEFWVVASDDGTPRLSSRIPIRIHLLDYNDNSPIFTSPNYHVSIADDSQSGSFAVKVAAIDADVNDTISYTLQPVGKNGNDFRCFRIDKTSGQIIYTPTALRTRACNPTRSSYSLDVLASDGVHKAVARVKVLMTPTNRNVPRFTKSTYNAFVSENQPPGTHVIKLTATDPDRGRFGKLAYFIMSEEHRWFFRIDHKTGEITTARPLDREEQNSFNIMVTVQDGGKELAHTNVVIHVNDENDNAPAFQRSAYRMNLLLSDVRPHKTLFRVRADDIDYGDNSTVRYYLSDPSPFIRSAVSIGDRTGEVRFGLGVQNATLLRRLQFTIRASDQGKVSRSSIVQVEILFLKIRPQFWPLIVNCQLIREHLNEWEKIDQPVARCYTPVKMKVSYSLLNGGLPKYNQDRKWFKIDQKSGIILTNRVLDREEIEKFFLTVQIRADTTPPTYGTTHVEFIVADRNDVTPHFQAKRYHLWIPENIKLKTRLMQIVATDEDRGKAGKLRYSLTPPVVSRDIQEVTERVDQTRGVNTDVRSYFEIDDQGWLQNVRELDRETRDEFIFSVEVSNDDGTHKNFTRVQINVEDVNDNPMTWKNSTAYAKIHVNESAPMSTVVYEMKYVDKDAYAWEPVRFWLLGGVSALPFTVESESGKVIVTGVLDREKKAHYLLEVMATDGKFSTKKPFRIEVRIDDADDNWPVCEEPFRTLEVDEGRKYSQLTRFKAIDKDEGYNARLNYKLIEGDSEHFELGKESGVLAVTQVLDRETKSSHFVRVNVSDPSGHHCLFEARIIVIDVNDNSPIFMRPPAISEVPENIPVSSPIGKVHAEDADAGLNRRVVYSFAKQENLCFSVDSKTGIITVSRPLDRERIPVHELLIVATDRGTPPRSSTMPVSVRLLDINDSPPEFTHHSYDVRVKESAPVNDQLIQVTATSDDIGQNSVIHYKLRDNYKLFDIDRNSGVIRLKNRLDFERARKHYLNVLAIDGGVQPLTGSTMVIIHVLDVNDNAPRFPRGGFNASMVENTPRNTLVTRVTADDADSDANSRLTYRLVGGDPLGHFMISEDTGELRVNKPVDREKQSAFRLQVEAMDFGIERRLSATTQVHINVEDLNDCNPQFDKPSYTFVIYVDKDGNITNAGGTSDRLNKAVAGKIYVSDADGPENAGPFSFRITQGNMHQFKLETHPNHCVVTAIGPLSPGEQMLNIKVVDSGRTPRKNTTRVTLQVVVQSRQPPVIERLNVTLSFYGSRDAPVGTIGHVRVRNRSPKDRLRFSLLSDYGGMFQIDQISGRLYAVRSLDGGTYSIRAKVSNGSLSSNSTVTVNVMALTEEMLDNAFVLRLSGFTPKLFFLDKKDVAWKRLLGRLFRISESKVYILAVQPAPDGMALLARRYKRQLMQRIDILTAVYSDDKLAFYTKKEVTSMLKDRLDAIKKELRHNNPLIFSDVCPSGGSSACVEGQGTCHSRPVIFGQSSSINVMGITHTSPKFRMETYCQCRDNFEGPRCEIQQNECARKPCKSPRVCQPTDGGRYRCVCPTGKTGENCELIDNQTPPDICRDPKCRRLREETPMMFKGRSYMNWTLRRPNPRRFDLSLQVRTKQKNAPFIKLRWAEHRAIRFYFQKGHLVVAPMSIDAVAVRTTSIAALATSSQRRSADTAEADESYYTPTSWLESPDRINDGKWHRIRFHITLSDSGKALRSWLVRLTIDGIRTKIVRVNWHEGSAREQELLMGAEVRSLLHGYTDIRSSFAGCTKDVQIGGVRLPQQTTYEQSPPFLLSRKVEVEFGCSDKFLDSACAESPCHNGGECHPDYQYSSRSYTCSCSAGFQGKLCEINTDPCSTNPCHNGGTCHSRGDSYECICPKGITGQSCEYGRYCGPSVNPCRNGAECIESYTGAVCQCSRQYKGTYCDQDVNECKAYKNICNGRGGCRNTIGSFVCNCSLGYDGTRCERQNLVRLTPDNNSWMLASSKVAWIVGGIFAVVIIALLLCLVIYFCVKYRRERKRSRRFHAPMNDLQKGETHPMIQLVTDSRLAHTNTHCYDPLLGSGTRNSLVSSTGLIDPQTENYVRYNDFSCPGTPNYSAHRLAQVGEETCPMGHPVTASSSQEGSDELDGPPSMHPLAQSTSSTSSNNNTVIIPGGLVNGRNGGLSYRPHGSGRVKKKMADFYPHHLAYVTAPASAVDPRLRVNLEGYASKQKSPSKMKTFRNMEEPEYFWDMSDVRPGLSDSPAVHHNRLASTVGEESELDLEDELDGMLAEGRPLWTPVESATTPVPTPVPATMPAPIHAQHAPPPMRHAAAPPLATRTAAGVSQGPVITVVDTKRNSRFSNPPPVVNGCATTEDEELPSRRLSNMHPDLYLPPHPTSLSGSHQTLGEEEMHEGPPTRKPPPPPLADGEEDDSDGGVTPTEEKTPTSSV